MTRVISMEKEPMKEPVRFYIYLAIVGGIALGAMLVALSATMANPSRSMAAQRQNIYLLNQMQRMQQLHVVQQDERIAWEARYIEKIETCEALADLSDALDEIDVEDCRPTALDDNLDKLLVEYLVQRLAETKQRTP